MLTGFPPTDELPLVLITPFFGLQWLEPTVID